MSIEDIRLSSFIISCDSVDNAKIWIKKIGEFRKKIKKDTCGEIIEWPYVPSNAHLVHLVKFV